MGVSVNTQTQQVTAMADPPIPTTTFELFYQDTWWVAKDGRVLRIDDMDPRHRDNLLPFLRRHADAYNDRCWRSLLHRIHLFSDTDAGDDAFDSILDDLAADDWIERTPLVAKLRKYAERRTVVGRLSTHLHNRTFKVRKTLGLTD
jgi:hypothetical protein